MLYSNWKHCELFVFVLIYACRVIKHLTAEERGLFLEWIKQVDIKLHPALTKLTWLSKNALDFVMDIALQVQRVRIGVVL